jgi:endoglucanase
MTVGRGAVAAVLALASATVALICLGTYGLAPWRRSMLVGVNLPSAAFGEQALPGKPGVDYFYPDETDIEYFTAKGMNVVRLGFLWERLQPALDQSLDDAEVERLDSAVRSAIRHGAAVILDLHNYARYRTQLIGSAAVPDESFADFWGRVAVIYKNTDQVTFGLMNEPHDIGAIQWLHSAQSAILRIRQTGARNRILVSSSNWDSASHFVADGDVWNRIVDPADNLAFEVHQYVDANNTGTHLDCPDTSVGIAAVRSVTQWMQENRRQVFLGEFGGSARQECLTALAQMLHFVQQHADVWLGWTYFAGGRGWADSDILSIQPTSNVDKPQMKLLSEYIRQ